MNVLDPLLVDDLDEVAGYPLPPDAMLPDDVEVEPAPEPDDADVVDRMLRRVRAIRRKKLAVERVAELEIARIREWQALRLGTLERQEVWLRPAIVGWLRKTHEETGAKTVNLPNGRLTVRPARRTVDASTVVDVAAFAADHPELARVKHEVALQAISKHCEPGKPVEYDRDPIEQCRAWEVVDTASGEIVPGVLFIQPVEPRFDFSVEASS